MQQNRQLPRANRWDSEILWLFAVSSSLVCFYKKKKEKKHFLFMTIITIAWLTHNKTKIKDEKGTWQCWALLVVLAYNKHNKLSFMSFTHERITCMMSHLPERHWGNKNDGSLKKVTAVTSVLNSWLFSANHLQGNLKVIPINKIMSFTV